MFNYENVSLLKKIMKELEYLRMSKLRETKNEWTKNVNLILNRIYNFNFSLPLHNEDAIGLATLYHHEYSPSCSVIILLVK